MSEDSAFFRETDGLYHEPDRRMAPEVVAALIDQKTRPKVVRTRSRKDTRDSIVKNDRSEVSVAIFGDW